MQWWWLSWMVKKIDKLLFSELKKEVSLRTSPQTGVATP